MDEDVTKLEFITILSLIKKMLENGESDEVLKVINEYLKNMKNKTSSNNSLRK